MALDETCPSINTRVDIVVVSNANGMDMVHILLGPHMGTYRDYYVESFPLLGRVECLTERERHFKERSGKGKEQFAQTW